MGSCILGNFLMSGLLHRSSASSSSAPGSAPGAASQSPGTRAREAEQALATWALYRDVGTGMKAVALFNGVTSFLSFLGSGSRVQMISFVLYALMFVVGRDVQVYSTNVLKQSTSASAVFRSAGAAFKAAWRGQDAQAAADRTFQRACVENTWILK